MRVRNLNAGAYNADGTVNINNFTATGPFYVYQEPVGLRDIASKAYVDLKTTSFDTAYFTSGTLAVARMPAFTGQLSKPAGSAAVTVSVGNTAAAGTYSSITVGAHGFVTAAGQLSSADVPSFSWTKITSGKPTTLAGWGITNALAKSGGTLTGPVSVSGTVAYTNPLHAVTKSIADTAITTMSAGVITYRTGDIRLLPTSSTPSGYLRCNGALLNKTTYASLYAVVGDTYRKSFIPGSGRPWEQQNFNEGITSNLTQWTDNTAAVMMANIWYGSALFATKNRVYMFGGEGNSGVTAAGQTAPINSDGSIGAWTTGIGLMTALSRSAAVTTKNKVYLIGGLLTSGSNTNAIYKATVNSDGTVSAFSLDTVSLPVAVCMSRALYTGSRVYMIGGVISSLPTGGVWSAPVDSAGNIGFWVAESNTLPHAVHSAGLCVTNNYVFLIGGSKLTGGSSVTTDVVQYAPINADGTIGAWATYSTPIPAAIHAACCVSTKSRVFLFGGTNVVGDISGVVYTAPINADGTLGSWTSTTGPVNPVTNSHVVLTKGKVTLVAGLYAGGTLYTNPQSTTLDGGLNDYSPYYDGTIVATPSTDFSIPTMTSNEGLGLYSYIKT